MTAQTVFEILVVVSTVTNMATLGLGLDLRETMNRCAARGWSC